MKYAFLAIICLVDLAACTAFAGPVQRDESPLADTVWEIPAQTCALLAEMPDGALWFVFLFFLTLWFVSCLFVRRISFDQGYFDGRADVLTALHDRKVFRPRWLASLETAEPLRREEAA